jgi:hypothetical protein
MKIRSGNYIAGKEIWDFNALRDWVCNEEYSLVDGIVPSARYRGTSIRRNGSGYSVVGWTRNVGQIHSSVFSFPCIVRAELKDDGTVLSAEIDSCFRGSKGPLCDRAILQPFLTSVAVGSLLIDLIPERVRVESLRCFHVLEVLAAAASAFALMSFYGRDSLFEEELVESRCVDESFALMGDHRILSLGKKMSYRFVFPEIKNKIAFLDDGSLVFTSPLTSRFILDDCEEFETTLRGSSKNRAFAALALISRKGIDAIKRRHFSGYSGDYNCTTMYPNAFIGGYMQSVSIDLKGIDLAMFQRTMSLLRSDESGPKCIGA